MEQEEKRRGRKAGVKIGPYRKYKKPEDRAKPKPALCIVGTEEELAKIRELAAKNKETISSFILRKALLNN